MKTENTPENKAAFFAQYWGQKVLIDETWSDYDAVKLDHRAFEYDYLGNKVVYLELTSLSNLSDEDAVEVDKICKFSYSYEPIVIGIEIRNWLIFNGTGLGNTSHKWDFLKAADYLRSRGYLIQWRDLTPDQLVSYGWVKVKTT